MAITERTRNGKLTFQVKVRDLNGDPYPQKTFDLKRKAKEYEAELLLLKSKGGKARSTSVRDMTLTEFYEDRWSRECRNENTVGWKKTQDQMFRDHVKPELGEKVLIEIDKSDIAKFLGEMSTKGLGDQMRLHLYNLLNQVFKDSVEFYDFRESNPVLQRFRPSPPKVVHSFLKPDAAREFINAISGHQYATAFWIMTMCGLRIGEIQALRWGNVDLNSATILINEQWIRKENRFGPTKNGQPIRIPMPPDLVDFLASRRPLNCDPQAFVAANKKGAMADHSVLWKALGRLCVKHGIQHLSPHGLRHTSTELWVQAGATPEDLRRLLNHSSLKSTMNYIHRSDERLTAQSKRVTKVIQNVIHLAPLETNQKPAKR